MLLKNEEVFAQGVFLMPMFKLVIRLNVYLEEEHETVGTPLSDMCVGKTREVWITTGLCGFPQISLESRQTKQWNRLQRGNRPGWCKTGIRIKARVY